MPSQTPKLFTTNYRTTGLVSKTEGIGMGSPSVDFSSRILERRTAVGQPVAAFDLPTAKLPPARNRGENPDQFLVNHNVKAMEVSLPCPHRV